MLKRFSGKFMGELFSISQSEDSDRFERSKTDKYLMHRTVKNNNPEILTLLIPLHDYNEVDSSGSTPLHYAVSKSERAECVRVLLETQCLRNIKDAYGNTPLLIAAKNNLSQIVELFIHDNGTNINIKDNRDMTPLHYAAQHRGDSMFIALLKSKNILINQKNIDGDTPLDIIIKNNDVQKLCTFLSYISDNSDKINIMNILTREVIAKLIKAKKYHVFICFEKYLSPIILSNIFNLEYENSYKPVHHAITHKNTNIVLILMKYSLITNTGPIKRIDWIKKLLSFSNCQEILNRLDFDYPHETY